MANKNINLDSDPSEGVKKLDRSKLKKRLNVNTNDDASPLKSIIMLIVITVLIAITGAYIFKNLQSTNTADSNDQDDKPNELATPTDEDSSALAIIGTNVEQDLFDEYKVIDKTYTNDDTEIRGNDSAEFELEKFLTQPYESFYRLEFEFDSLNSDEVVTSGSGSELAEEDTIEFAKVPYGNIDYEEKEIGNEVMITFSNISDDETPLAEVLGTEAAFEINNSSVEEITYEPIDITGNLVFSVKLLDDVNYYVQVVGNKVVLDIEEAEVRSNDRDIEEPTPEVTEMDDGDEAPEPSSSPTPSITPDSTPTGPTSFETDIEAQNITASNKAQISGFTYDDTSDAFVYQLKLVGKVIPKISSRINEEGNLVMKVEEISFDGLTKDGKAFTNFAENGVKDVVSMDVTFGGTTSTYVYTLTEPKDYDISVKEIEGENRIVIEIQH